MGVHELWPVLEPVKRHVPLQSLSGKTLAVDLSIWVCEAQSVKQMVGVVAKPHLRNLFFRVSSLSLMGVKLVFVTEGEAPKIKANTMNKRNEMRFGPSSKPAPSKPGRSYFRSVLKECLCMLDCLGVPWVQAAGEAEAMCAYLDAKGHVDGCITNDGDVFLYGAQTVYRNFTMNVKDPHVDCYKASAIQDKLGLDRESLVSLAILLGCDYVPKGLPGIGRETAVKFLRSLNGESALQRFHQWRKQFDDPTNPPKTAKKTVHCSVCCHPGSAKEHERKGCGLCGSNRYCEPHDYDYSCPCEWHKAEQEKKDNPLEYTLKTKAKKREGFPYPEVIKEFLINKDKLLKVIKWVRPRMLCFQNFALERMDWPKHYACEKVVVLLTYYDMHERKAGRQDDTQLQAVRIVKPRVRNGVPCFEIEWVKPDSYVFPDDHPPDTPLLTIEEENLFSAAYPHVVEMFQKEKLEAEMLKQKSKKSKPKSKVLPDMDDVASLLSEMSLAPMMKKTPPINTSDDEDLLPTTNRDSPGDLQGLLLSTECSPPAQTTENDSNVSTSLFHEDETESLDGAGLSLQDPCPSPVMTSRPESAVSSPNMSSVFSDLHLSDIDWEATSFSRSPQIEGHADRKKEHDLKDKPSAPEQRYSTSHLANVNQETVETSKCNLVDKAEQMPALALDSPCISHLEKIPLRERILLKNAQQAGDLSSQNHHVKDLSSYAVSIAPSKSKPITHNSMKKSVAHKENVHVHPKLIKHPSYQNNNEHTDLGTNVPGKGLKSLQSPRTKSFSFVKKSALVPVRSLSDCRQTDKIRTKKVMLKKSVCQKMALSSEDEEEQGKDKSKDVVKVKMAGTTTELSQRKMASTLQTSCSPSPTDNSFSATDDVFLSPKLKNLVNATSEREDSDCDDSIVSVDSPLPLSERLKLRLLHNC
ncbi:flap endonuclease GEN homolog 1 [Hyperolius riggenbachi]|uniref:flap endonuclease GEN homolog 1 n=1 Tax=Hyperolius riggenbachi TaxID=752182 RepID=UPI0035A3AFE2